MGAIISVAIAGKGYIDVLVGNIFETFFISMEDPIGLQIMM